jgi:hypothetical protein
METQQLLRAMEMQVKQLVVHDNDKYDAATLFSQVFSLVTND